MTTPNLCKCNNGFYEDRKFSENQYGCPACDPELGNDIETRKKNYKLLISYPVSDEVKYL